MVQARKLVLLAGAAVATLLVLRRGRHAARGHQVPGGILIGDAVVYDTLSRLLLGPFLTRIAADVAAVAPHGARVLEVGCGPGHLSVQLAGRHGLEVTGLDLDPAMIARARAYTDPPETVVGADHRSWWATRPHWRSLTGRSTWSSAPCRCTTGPTRRPAWPRLAASCARMAGRSSGTSGLVLGSIHLDQAARTCPIRRTTHMVLRFGWRTRRPGIGRGGSRSPSGSS
jgi:Methyltransferase domain